MTQKELGYLLLGGVAGCVIGWAGLSHLDSREQTFAMHIGVTPMERGGIPAKECNSGPKLPASAPKVKVAEWTWVKVANRSVSNCNGTFKKGETCGIKAGGTVAGIKAEGDRILMQYETPGNQNAFGSPCPSGTLFFEHSHSPQREEISNHTQVTAFAPFADQPQEKGINSYPARQLAG